MIVSYLSHNIILGTTAQGFAWEGTGSDRAGRFYDKVDSYTKLLLHCDGADASTNFVDSATTPKTVTVYGNAQIDTANKQFGTGSAFFDGDGDYADTPDSDDFNMGTGDCTIDFWVCPNGLQSANYPSILCNSINWATGTLGIRYDNAGGDKKFGVWWNPSDPEIMGSTQHEPDAWYHIAVTRTGTSLILYVNGINEGSSVCGVAEELDLSKSILRLGYGQWDGVNGWFKGWIDELRISKGIVRWTANFTPPTHPYSD